MIGTGLNPVSLTMPRANVMYELACDLTRFGFDFKALISAVPKANATMLGVTADGMLLACRT